MSIFLSDQEMEELTDRRLPGAQRKWLEARGWRFEVTASGKPKVARSEFEFRMVSSSTQRNTRRGLVLEAIR